MRVSLGILLNGGVAELDLAYVDGDLEENWNHDELSLGGDDGGVSVG